MIRSTLASSSNSWEQFGNDGVDDQYFETPEQLWEYARAVLPPKLRRSPDAPISLPVLQTI